MTFGERFRLTLLTDDVRLAEHAQRSGVDRIGPDLETIGKQERQRGTRSRISNHREASLPALRRVLRSPRLFVRTNPSHPGIDAEIERLLSMGADVLMLPMFRSTDEVKRFVDRVAGRAIVVPLVETATAMARIHEIAALSGVDEICVGLNDLHLDLRLSSHFELLASPVMDMISTITRSAGKPLAFGGIARVDDHTLPIPPDVVLAQYPRLQGTGALISRAFGADTMSEAELAEAIRRVRARLDHWASASPAAIVDAYRTLCDYASAPSRTAG